ncbi:hypothetical protein C7445_10955 [Alicyclobacillus sacchari]|uniref:Uncharacterized protein n=1 Tax=Alicyclobacillus sacchari TaxID=392010 RepID=A0A4R8LMG4_9BACL|nr:hypothetical protein C7445_10955 [Alicyclobacillus sacchari]
MSKGKERERREKTQDMTIALTGSESGQKDKRFTEPTDSTVKAMDGIWREQENRTHQQSCLSIPVRQPSERVRDFFLPHAPNVIARPHAIGDVGTAIDQEIAHRLVV